MCGTSNRPFEHPTCDLWGMSSRDSMSYDKGKDLRRDLRELCCCLTEGKLALKPQKRNVQE